MPRPIARELLALLSTHHILIFHSVVRLQDHSGDEGKGGAHRGTAGRYPGRVRREPERLKPEEHATGGRQRGNRTVQDTSEDDDGSSGDEQVR